MVFDKHRFAQRLRETIKQRGNTQTTLAHRVGISKKSMNIYCTGGCLPPADTFSSIAHELGVSADYLLYGEGTESDAHPQQIQDLAKMAARLRPRDRHTLMILTYSLIRGNEDIQHLLSAFAKTLHHNQHQHTAHTRMRSKQQSAKNTQKP